MSPDARAVLEAVARAKLAAAVENDKKAAELEKEAAELRKSAAAGRAVANELATLRAPPSSPY
ncbi:MAG: hypothetical protein WAN86_22820 [Hyphomicrobiaceae bacterium]